VGYRELLQALEEEVKRQIQERRAEASREQGRILEAARAELLARREAVLTEERRLLADEAARALSGARLEQERALLGEMRRQLGELRSAAESRLSTMNDAELLMKLVDEVVPELGEGPLVFRVKDGYAAELESHLRLHHPDLVARSTVVSSPDVGGGVEVSLGTRQRLDNTLRSRLDNAWRQLEPEIAAILLEGKPTPGPPGASPDEAVGVASLAGGRDGAL
jgi:vacuolar-type H+-ATPase subunit E/Vma4